MAPAPENALLGRRRRRHRVSRRNARPRRRREFEFYLAGKRAGKIQRRLEQAVAEWRLRERGENARLLIPDPFATPENGPPAFAELLHLPEVIAVGSGGSLRVNADHLDCAGWYGLRETQRVPPRQVVNGAWSRRHGPPGTIGKTLPPHVVSHQPVDLPLVLRGNVAPDDSKVRKPRRPRSPSGEARRRQRHDAGHQDHTPPLENGRSHTRRS